MDRSDFVAITTDIHLARMDLMIDKSEDYAGEDVLANFKRMNQLASLLGISTEKSPTDCALFLALLKLDRWCNLRKKGVTKPRNESIKDTVKDLHNYIDFAYACEENTRCV